MARLSLCMIVRDEASFIETFVARHRSLADEIVIVDTGSTDGTPDLARRAGARVDAIAWPDDFAAARNESLARATGDWILVLDADERFEPPSFPRVRELLDAGTSAAYAFPVHTYSNEATFFLWQPRRDAVPGADGYAGYYATYPIRLFRNHVGIRFHGQVHESVQPSLVSAGLSWEQRDPIIHHFTEARTAAARTEKRRRYLALSEAQAQREPHSDKAQLELGMAALDVDEVPLAIAALERAVRLAPERIQPWEFLGVAFTRARDLGRAAQTYAEASRRFPRYASFRAGLGEALLALGRIPEARLFLTTCLALDPSHFRAAANLGVLEMRAGDDDAAAAWLARAKDINPHSDLADLNLGLLLARRGERDAALAHLHRAAGLNPARWEAPLAIGSVQFDAGDYEEATRWYERAAAVPGHGAAVYAKLCAAELARENFAAARLHARAAGRLDARYATLEALVPADREPAAPVQPNDDLVASPAPPSAR
jgi:Flp pilus assembly protein TadD